MENLSLHIEYLLLRHDCVVLPGLGAFINIRHAARFESATGRWFPMTVEVRYNSALNHDDGLLASSYARKFQVSFQEGRDMLNREIRELTETLDSDGEVTIGHLGILQKEEDSIIFHPIQTAEHRAISMGYIPVAQNQESDTPAETADEIKIFTSTASEMTEKSAASETERKREFDTQRNYYLAINKIFARTAASIIVIFLMALAVILPISDSKHEDQASVVPVEKIIRDTASRIASSKADTTLIITANEEANENNQDRPVDIINHRYHAIVATFATPAEAEQFIAQHEDAGYNLSVVSTRTKSRVSAISSDDSSEVRKRMNEEAFQSEFSEAWIWENTMR